MAALEKIASRAQLALPLILALGFSSPNARAQSPLGYSGPGRYEIESVASGKAVEIDLRDRRTVRQWTAVHQGDQPNPPNNLRNQQWDIEDAGYSYVRIKSAETGMALDAEQPNTRVAVPVILSRPSNEQTQLWRIEPAGEGEVKITSRIGKALDLPDGSHSNGTHLQIFPPNPGDNQKFRFFRVGFALRGYPERTAPERTAPDSSDRGGYDLGYRLGLEDFRSQLRRTYARHKGEYNHQLEESFIEGYYDGYDNGREGSARMRDADRDPYDAGYRLGRQDSQESRRPDYLRYADRFDSRSEPLFRRGYADGYHAAP